MDIMLISRKGGYHATPYSGEFNGRLAMSKTVLWLIIIFSILFVIGVNTGEVGYLMNLGSTI
jgi:hypothetical protein